MNVYVPYMCRCVCVNVSLRVYNVCVRICLCITMCVRVNVSFFICHIDEYMSLCISMRVRANVSLCMCYVCVSKCVSVYVPSMNVCK